MKSTFTLLFLFIYLLSFSQDETTLIKEGHDFYSKGNYKAALESYKAATVANPGSSEAHRLVGETYFRIVKLEPCIISLEKSLELDSNNNKALLDLAIAKSRLFTQKKKQILLNQSDSICNKIILRKYEVPLTYMQLSYNSYYRKDYDKCWKYIYKVKALDEEYINKKFVLDLYVEHPDSLNAFNIKEELRR